jgi:hypothetical protein
MTQALGLDTFESTVQVQNKSSMESEEIQDKNLGFRVRRTERRPRLVEEISKWFLE